MTKGVTEICEHCICANAQDHLLITQRQQQQYQRHNSPLHQLQDSLCALCIRCLPLRQFPVHPSLALPITFVLPKTCVSSDSPTGYKKTKVHKVQGEKLDIAGNSLSSSDDEAENVGNEFLCESYGSDGTCGVKDALIEKSTELNCKVVSPPKRENTELEASYMHLFGEFKDNEIMSTGTTGKKTGCNSVKMLAQKIRGVVPFVKIAFPELAAVTDDDIQNPLNENDVLNRDALVQQVLHFRDCKDYADYVVYDLDELILKSQHSASKDLSNDDVNRVGKTDTSIGHLLFESRFEGGNLRRATQVGERHYELMLSPDLNQKKPHFQWFYFEVSNMQPDVPYTFEIINCIKSASMFSSGMQPVLFSVTDYLKKHCGWTRAGSSICYYRNVYVPNIAETSSFKKKNSSTARKRKNGDVRCYYTTKFEMVFQNPGDVCYIAYHFPYTYSFLVNSLNTMINSAKLVSKSIIAVSESLCSTLAGNSVPLVTITSAGNANDIRKRDVVVLFARVHPGESNSSWMMHGVLEFLLSHCAEAVHLREQFIFKLIPMLNPDGVINGSHRCSLAGVDLNRVWDEPLSNLHPTIYHSKGILEYLVNVLKKPPILVVDFHGHSRRFNVFMYGNNPKESWKSSDHAIKHNQEFLALPEILAERSELFSLVDCAFGITQGKESSARVVLWRQLHLTQMYTMEASYCGFDRGSHAGNQVTTSQLKQLGRNLCESVASLKIRLCNTPKVAQCSVAGLKKGTKAGH